MQGSFFILLRFYLRVDGVLVRINDTRIHYQVQDSLHNLHRIIFRRQAPPPPPPHTHTQKTKKIEQMYCRPGAYHWVFTVLLFPQKCTFALIQKY